MGRFHVKKQDTFIDMTPMSDVMVLLLTFFMLTATFTKEEPVKVNVPGSVSDIKIPENNLLTIYVSPQGKVFMNMDNPTAQKAMAQNLVGQQEAGAQQRTAQTVLRSSDVRDAPQYDQKLVGIGRQAQRYPPKRSQCGHSVRQHT